MTKKKTPTINIDGASISKSITAIKDSIKYRKYGKKDYVLVLFINKENNSIEMMDGKINDKTIAIRGLNVSYLVDKIYLHPMRKVVTKICLIKEDCNSTLDIKHTDLSALTPALLDKYTNIKLMEEFNGFNMGQVFLGGMIGIVVGLVGGMLMIMAYNSLL
jgi:hypothetical protein